MLECLDALPTDHPDRNKPLVGCWYKWRDGKMWNQIKSTYGIACTTYNDLGPAWAVNDVFCWNPYP
jgi:hypothetical protein